MDQLDIRTSKPQTPLHTNICIFHPTPGYPTDSRSGVRPNRETGPVAEGGKVIYSCPGVKRNLEGTLSDWTATCAASGSYVFDPALPSWPECQCYHSLEGSQCPAASYETVYADGGELLCKIDSGLDVAVWKVQIPRIKGILVYFKAPALSSLNLNLLL